MEEVAAARVISRATARHYVWGGAREDASSDPQGSVPARSDGWHLVESAALSVIEERMPAGAEERRHRHTRAQQFFYVLEGLLTVEAAGDVHTCRVGEGLHVPAGVIHQVFNRSAADVRFLVVSQPASHGDRIDG